MLLLWNVYNAPLVDRLSKGWWGLQWVAKGHISKYIGVGRFQELDVVLQASVGAIWLLQAILHIPQSALISSLHLSIINKHLTDQLYTNLYAQWCEETGNGGLYLVFVVSQLIDFWGGSAELGF